MVELGRFLGNYAGGAQPPRLDDIRRVGLSNNVRVCWPQNGRTESVEHIIFNREKANVVFFGQTEGEGQIPDENRVYIDVLSSGPKNADEPIEVLRKFIRNISNRRVELTWEASIDPTDVFKYKILSNGGAGVVLDTILGEVESSVFRFVTEDLSPGTWIFKINPIDAFGNELTSSLTASVVVPDIIDPPGLPISATIIDSTIPTIKIEWGASPTAGVDKYVVYDNDGLGFTCEGAPDFDDPFAEIAAPGPLDAIGTAGEGDWIFLVRAEVSGEDDGNFDRRVEVRIVKDGTTFKIVGSFPNPVSFVTAEPQDGGTILITAVYNPVDEETKGKTVNIYVALSTEEIDFDTDLFDTIDIPDHTLGEGEPFELEVEIGPLAEDEYLIVFRVEDDTGVEETSDVEIVVTNDATPPLDISSLTAELI